MVYDDLETAYNVLSPRDECFDNKFRDDAREFLLFYLFTNEDMSYFFNKVDITNKKVLTVGSSGDQAIYALINGAKEIVHFDLNPFAKYYFDFKIALIKNLTFNEFVNAYHVSKNPGTLSPSLYAKISHDINDESRFFWDTLFLDGFGTDFAYLHLVGTGQIPYTKQEYENMQRFFKNNSYSISFINCDLRDIDKNLAPNQKFDLIMLSNIYDYITNKHDLNEYIKGKETFKNALNILEKHLNKNGQIQFEYVWESVDSHLYAISSLLTLKNTYKIENPNMDSGSLMYAPDGLDKFNVIEMQ